MGTVLHRSRRPLPRAGASESSSSKNSTQGRARRALAKISRTCDRAQHRVSARNKPQGMTACKRYWSMQVTLKCRARKKGIT